MKNDHSKECINDNYTDINEDSKIKNNKDKEIFISKCDSIMNSNK